MLDEVKTLRGKAGITFADNTQVQVNENSRLVIDDFVYDSKSSKGGKLAVNIASGTVRYASGQIAKNSPQSVSVNTPTATIVLGGPILLLLLTSWEPALLYFCLVVLMAGVMLRRIVKQVKSQ
jgi:hypothetical protein